MKKKQRRIGYFRHSAKELFPQTTEIVFDLKKSEIK